MWQKRPRFQGPEKKRYIAITALACTYNIENEPNEPLEKRCFFNKDGTIDLGQHFAFYRPSHYQDGKVWVSKNQVNPLDGSTLYRVGWIDRGAYEDVIQALEEEGLDWGFPSVEVLKGAG